MDPASRNWLQRLAQSFDETFRANPGVLLAFYESEREFDTFIFRLLHTSGLLFGHPHTTCFVQLNEMPEWTETDRAKVVLAETFFHAFLFTHKIWLKENGTIQPLLDKAVDSISDFYNSNYAELKESKWSFRFVKSKKPVYDRVEIFINKRSYNASVFERKYWLNAPFNTFVFLDLVYYASWLSGFDKQLSVWYEHIQIQMLVIMAAAMHSDSAVENPERTMYHYFLSGSEITEQTRRRLEKILKKGINIEELNFTLAPHPLFFRIYLEMGIIASLADSVISEQEVSFIKELATKLGISSEQKDECIFITESFFVAHQNKLIYLRNRDTFDVLNRNLQRRMHGLVKKNHARIMRELMESKELVELLIKSQRTSLTPEEKEKVKEQLTDVLRTIPSLAIFMIPGGSILLPILLKILPDELLKPSSFRN